MIVLTEKNDNGEINVMEMLMTIREDIASINTKLDDMGNTDKKADRALAKAIENEHRIGQISIIQNWFISLTIAGILIPIIIYLIEKLV